MSDPATASSPRGPSVLYTAAMVMAVMVIAIFLVAAPQNPPPAIAEISPQAVEQIKEPPPEQSSEFASAEGGECLEGQSCEEGEEGEGPGEGPGGGAPTTTTLPPTTTTPPTTVPRVNRCVGDPPRQIEDPQSPPCVPFWEGDNGGDTSPGVTADTIRIAIPSLNPNDGGEERMRRALEDFFNNRFQFYNRKLQLISTEPDGGSEAQRNTQDPVDTQRAWAQKTEARGVFASTGVAAWSGVIYQEELARRGIVSTSVLGLFTEAQLVQHHPYMWQYSMTLDDAFANTGEWICSRFAGSSATFGILYHTAPGLKGKLPADALRGELDRCGADVGHEATINAFEESQNDKFQRAINKFKLEGVTDVVCICHVSATGAMTRQATLSLFFPDWLVMDYIENNVAYAQRLSTPEQSGKIVGLTYTPRQLLAGDDPAIWALNEADPGFFDRGLWDASQKRQQVIHNVYRQLLLLASGIQMAGPNLTPETFAQGLQTTTFPNPDHPIMAGKVGFGDGHAMTTDTAEWWWSPTAPTPYRGGQDPLGAYCYIDGGARRQPGAYPAGDSPFRKGPCDSGTTRRS